MKAITATTVALIRRVHDDAGRQAALAVLREWYVGASDTDLIRLLDSLLPSPPEELDVKRRPKARG